MTGKKDMKRGIIVAGFGSTYQTARNTIDCLEIALSDAFPGIPLCRAWTSDMVRKKLYTEQGVVEYSPREAFEWMKQREIREVAVLSTHLIGGFEYEKLCRTVQEFEPYFDKISLGHPLLDSGADRDCMISAVMKEFSLEKEDALVLMGHGTNHEVNAVYRMLNDRIKELGYTNVYLGTVEAQPGFDEVFAEVDAQQPKRVILAPFLMVAGDHATNDLAGEGADSWKSRFEAAGYPVECVMVGLADYGSVRAILMNRLGGLLGIE